MSEELPQAQPASPVPLFADNEPPPLEEGPLPERRNPAQPFGDERQKSFGMPEKRTLGVRWHSVVKHSKDSGLKQRAELHGARRGVLTESRLRRHLKDARDDDWETLASAVAGEPFMRGNTRLRSKAGGRKRRLETDPAVGDALRRAQLLVAERRNAATGPVETVGDEDLLATVRYELQSAGWRLPETSGPQPQRGRCLSADWLRRNAGTADLERVATNTRELRRIPATHPTAVAFLEETRVLIAEHNISMSLFCNIDEMPLRWWRTNARAWLVSCGNEEVETPLEFRLRRYLQPRRRQPRRCGHSDEPAHAKVHMTDVTGATPFVKAPLLLICKARKVGSGARARAALNRLNQRYLKVISKGKRSVHLAESVFMETGLPFPPFPLMPPPTR